MTDTTGQALAERDVMTMRIDALHEWEPAALLSIAGAVMAIYVYWGEETRLGLVVWGAAIAVVSIGHFIGFLLYRRGLPRGWAAPQWARAMGTLYLLSGLCWGVGAAWMLGRGDEQQALVICCLALGAATVSLPAVVYAPAFNLFQIPVFLLCGVSLASSGLEFGWVLSIAAALLCVCTALIGHRLGGQLVLALRLSQENARLARNLAQRSAALEEANRELEIQSLTDPLTGVANRRHLMSFVRAVPGRCSVLMIDVDHFKRYNDSFGHVEGDACLVAVAGVLRRAVREGRDLVARQGGEEFAVVLVDRPEHEALAVAEAIRAGVETLSAAVPGRLRGHVTVSVGFAHRGARETTPHAELLGAADAAVYEAKNSGRNRVCHASPRRYAAAG